MLFRFDCQNCDIRRIHHDKHVLHPQERHIGSAQNISSWSHCSHFQCCCHGYHPLYRVQRHSQRPINFDCLRLSWYFNSRLGRAQLGQRLGDFSQTDPGPGFHGLLLPGASPGLPPPENPPQPHQTQNRHHFQASVNNINYQLLSGGNGRVSSPR